MSPHIKPKTAHGTRLFPRLRGYSLLPGPPTKDEQTAIATVLSDMDAEFSAQEARHDKTRALKQAMMQALLTGRIRLV